MIFNSIEFVLFLPLVFVAYWFALPGQRNNQNILILVASYVFYGWWDYRFLFLIAFSTILDYSVGLAIDKAKTKQSKKAFLYSSVFLNLGVLGFFKYFNFFAENFARAFSQLGWHVDPFTLNVILPVGISFYTFQTMSYTIDVYKGRIKTATDFIAFASFVSFFPQLVAGPIERASKLLPQFQKDRSFSYPLAVDGMRQILWGFFKKVVIADNCAEIVNPIFAQQELFNGSTLALGAFFFTIQIYADFSGYSDMAIGIARLFGFSLSKNFAFPYFSRSLPEAWTKWHISLTNWFRDYLYLPLALKHKKNRAMLGVLVVFQFVVIGFWHGANWTFIAWGAFHALFMLPYTLIRTKKSKFSGRIAQGRFFPTRSEAFGMIRVFTITYFSMILFRSASIQNAVRYVGGMFSWSLFEFPQVSKFENYYLASILVAVFLILEWLGREGEYALDILVEKLRPKARYVLYYMLILSVFLFAGMEQEFIYFQF